MNQKAMLLLSAALTAFVLVVIGILIGNFNAAASATTVPAHPTVPIVDASTTGSDYALTAEQAASLALAAAPGAALQSTPELVSFQGTPAYEVRTDLGLLYVDANTGSILASGVATGNPGNNSGWEAEDHESEAHEHERGHDHDD